MWRTSHLTVMWWTSYQVCHNNYITVQYRLQSLYNNPFDHNDIEQGLQRECTKKKLNKKQQIVNNREMHLRSVQLKLYLDCQLRWCKELIQRVDGWGGGWSRNWTYPHPQPKNTLFLSGVLFPFHNFTTVPQVLPSIQLRSMLAQIHQSGVFW